MPSIEIKQLHNYSRFPKVSNKIIPLLLYAPFGILLVLLRLIIFLPISLLCTILPSTQLIHGALLKLLCVTLGISINIENPDKKEDVEAFISNHVSIFDHLIIHSLTGCVMPSTKLDSTLSSIYGVKFFGAMSNFEAFKGNIATFLSDSKTPLYFQPEAAITNGKAVLKFNAWPFNLCSKLQPVIIDVKRPLFNISVSLFDSTYWTDVFFFMFSPLTIYNVQFLPSAEKKGLNEKEYAKKMQEDIARALKIEAVDHSASDLKEWFKRYQIELNRAQVVQRPVSNINMELHRMGLQVKEVLPMVPLNDILRDLAKTRNVDITITNILEGTVPYTPEQIASAPSTSSTTSTSEVKSNVSATISASSSPYPQQGPPRDPFNTAAQTFGKSASERSLSFQERKQQLIENARRRYIEKHCLNIVALNNC